MKPAKVLMVIDRLGRGGVAQVTMNLALSLDRQKFEPIVCTTRQKPAHGHDKILRDAGVRLIELKRRTRLDLFSWRPLWKLLPEVDILHTHLSGSNFWGRLWGAYFRVPIIVTHEHAPADEKEWYEHLVDKTLSPLSHKIIAVSEYDRQRYIKRERITPQKIETIYVGIDTERFSCRLDKQEARRRLGLPADKQIIIIIARLMQQKNHHGFLDAWLQLPESDRENYHCLLVGSGDLEEELRRRVATLGQEDQIEFLGERSDVPDLLCASDLMVLPSLFECLPSVVSEAMATGCPVAATAVGGVPEMIGDVGWPLPPPGDANALAQAIAEVLHMPSSERERKIKAGRERVHRIFSKENAVAEIQQLYESLLAERSEKRVKRERTA